MSFNRGMDKEDTVHIYDGMLLSHKKDEITAFAAMWLDLETVTLHPFTPPPLLPCSTWTSVPGLLTEASLGTLPWAGDL